MSSDYLFLIFGIIHVALGQTIDEKPEDKTSCVGRDVEIPWHFKDETNLNIATWSVTSSALTGNILRKIGSASATILNSYNVVHNSNGKITLTSLTTDNSGTFKLSVTYNSATTAEEDTVELTVSETPTATLRCEDGSCQFDGGTTLGLVLSTEVNETRKYCCVTGAAAACIDGSTGTKYCIEGSDPTTTTITTTTTTEAATTTQAATTTSQTTTTISTTTASTTTTAFTTTTTPTTSTASTTSTSITQIASSTQSPSSTTKGSQKSEWTIIIVVSSTVGGVVLCGLLAFLGLFLYRSRRSGSPNNRHGHKKNTSQQKPDSPYFYGGHHGRNNYNNSMYASFEMNRNMAPRNSVSTDREYNFLNQHRYGAHRQDGMPNHKSAYNNSYYTVYPSMSYPSNPQGHRSGRFLPNEYQMNERRHRPATSGSVHLATYHPSERVYNDNRSYLKEYADNWDMY